MVDVLPNVLIAIKQVTMARLEEPVMVALAVLNLIVCLDVLFAPVIVEMVVKEDARLIAEDVLVAAQGVITVAQDALELAAEDVKELALLLVLNNVQDLVPQGVLAIVIMGVQVKKLIN
jgi:hypothetical protein